MDLGATPIFEISVKNCKSEPELKFEVENRKLILPQRTCEGGKSRDTTINAGLDPMGTDTKPILK